MNAIRIFVCIIVLVAAADHVRAQDHVLLHLLDWADLDEMPGDVEAIDSFKVLYPTIDVIYEPNPGRVYEEKILTALAAGDAPDVFLLDSKLIPSFTNKRVLLDLSPYCDSLQVDTAQWFSTLLNIARHGAQLFAFPKGFSPLMIFYNKELFRELGVPYPVADWTWDDYLRTARLLTRDSNGDGVPEHFGTGFTNYYFYWIPWVWSAGGDVVTEDGLHASGRLNASSTESALQFLVDLRLKYGVAPDVGSWVQSEKTGANYALFANGTIGMVLDGHWRMPTFLKFLREKKLDIGVAPFPRHPVTDKTNVMYESGWCVPKTTLYPRQAALLASFMAGETACRIRARNRLELPSSKKVAEEMVRLDSTGMERAFIDEIRYCRQPWGTRIERFSEIEWTLQDAVDEVMLNRKPMHETMTAYASRVDRQLEDIRSHASFEFVPIRDHSEIGTFLLAVAGCVFGGCVVLYFVNAGKKERRKTASALTFLAPSLLHLTVFILTPIIFAAYLSTREWDIVVPNTPFVGIGNFAEIVSDVSFWGALRNTFVYSLNVPLSMAIALSVALMMHKRIKGIGILRTLYFLPSVTSFVAIALVWMWLYHPTFGAANFLLGLVGLPAQQWLNSTGSAMFSVVVFTVWLGFGYQMVVFLAGLQSIPEELYEAARIDGASPWQKFWRITLPLLKPTTFFVLVTSLIGSFQVFTLIYVMTAGGPVRSTDVLVYHIYTAAWEQLRMGYASAMSWVLFIIIMIATWIQFKFLGKEIEY